jgi:hypothetical protein
MQQQTPTTDEATTEYVFSEAELARLTCYKAAVAAGFYNDRDVKPDTDVNAD